MKTLVLSIVSVFFTFSISASAFESITQITHEDCSKYNNGSQAKKDCKIGNAVYPVVAVTVAGVSTLAGMSTLGTLEALLDARQVESLLDQAYSGDGDDLRILSQTFGLSVEETADAIVELDESGKLGHSSHENTKRAIISALRRKAALSRQR